MHTENLGLIFERHVLLDVGQEIITFVNVFDIRHLVVFWSTEAVAVLVDDIIIVEIHQDGVDGGSVVYVCNSASIVSFSNHVPEGFEWNALVVVQELD